MESVTETIFVSDSISVDSQTSEESSKRETCYQPLKEAVYHNFTMVGPDGKVLCRCGRKKVDWYLSRNLATVICEDPYTIQLKFKPGGDGEHGDSYQLAEKDNCCVVCGRDNYNTKHHVVEYEYRQFMPLEYKSHNSYDIIILCGPCHTQYEIEAMKVKMQLAKKYDAPLNGKGWYHDSDLGQVKKAAVALLKTNAKIPANRIEELNAIVKKYLNKNIDDKVTVDELEQLAQIKTMILTDEYVTHGKAVVSQLKSSHERLEFIQMWRRHFLETMKPQFIHPNWGIKRERDEISRLEIKHTQTNETAAREKIDIQEHEAEN